LIFGSVLKMKNNPSYLRFHPFWLAVGWLWILGVIYLSLIPEPPGIDGPWGDKIGHAAAYTALMLWFAQLYPVRSNRLWAALGLIALGIAIEFAQEQTGYRKFEVADMFADALGVAVGFILAETPLRRVLELFERFASPQARR
jgi:VanZ family protein